MKLQLPNARLQLRVLALTTLIFHMPYNAVASALCGSSGTALETVTSHRSFAFVRDWSAFKSDLADFKDAVAGRDAHETRRTSIKLQSSLAAVKSYGPVREGELCAAFASARNSFTAIEPSLADIATTSDYRIAEAVATDLIKTSRELRASLPTSWFVRHRDGRRYH